MRPESPGFAFLRSHPVLGKFAHLAGPCRVSHHNEKFDMMDIISKYCFSNWFMKTQATMITLQYQPWWALLPWWFHSGQTDHDNKPYHKCCHYYQHGDVSVSVKEILHVYAQRRGTEVNSGSMRRRVFPLHCCKSICSLSGSSVKYTSCRVHIEWWPLVQQTTDNDTQSLEFCSCCKNRIRNRVSTIRMITIGN
jgi:hypothetical protein